MKLKIAYQGVAGAYSHIASQTVYPGADYLACASFEEAMAAVTDKKVDLAMIPVENSNAGRVSDVHFLLPSTGLHIVGEFFCGLNTSFWACPEPDFPASKRLLPTRRRSPSVQNFSKTIIFSRFSGLILPFPARMSCGIRILPKPLLPRVWPEKFTGWKFWLPISKMPATIPRVF